MIRGFRKSRMAFAGVSLLTLVLVVAIWFRDQNHPVIVPIIASCLMLGIGYVSARVLGNILSNVENTRYLGYLHMELDPEKFLAQYSPIPQRLKEGSVSQAICRSYLSDGYRAKGDFGQALALLEQLPPGAPLSLQGLYAANRAACQLELEDLAAAQGSILRLEEIIQATRLNNGALSENLDGYARLLRQHWNCRTGRKVNTAVLEEEFQKAQYHLRRLEIAKVLAMAARQAQDPEALARQLTFLKENGGKTFYAAWAQAQE